MLFRVLGPIEVDGPDGAVLISADKPRRLLSVLLMNANLWVTVDNLIEEVWPKGPPASAARNVKTYVSHLRRVLESADDTTERIERRPGAYRLTVSRAELDATVFEDLVDAGELALRAGDFDAAVSRFTEALSLWRGRPYESLGDGRTGSSAERLDELRWTANDGLAVAMMSAGRSGEAIAILRAVTADNPFREPAWKHLMEALHASGRRADALNAYQEARRHLSEELGVEPGAELQQFHVRLLRESAEESSPAELPPPTVAPAPVVAHRPTRRWWQTLTRVRMPALAATVVVVMATMSTAAAPVADHAKRVPKVATTPRTNAADPGVSPRRPVPGVPAPGDAKVTFGVGSQANSAMVSELARETPVSILNTWFHEPKNLIGLRGWRSELVPRAYRDGYALHLVLADWGEGTERAVDTRYGPGCGRPYALSVELLDHVRELATIFAGRPDDPPLYVTVFHGVNIYACDDGWYQRSPTTTAYLRALKDQYLRIREIFHFAAPNARVSLGWQGWQANEDEPETGGGRSMFEHFADVLRASDFQSVVMWEPRDNVEPVRKMVPALGAYGPVLVYYGNGNTIKQDVYDRDMRSLLADESLVELSGKGLFAWTFAESTMLRSNRPTMEFVKAAIRRDGRRSR